MIPWLLSFLSGPVINGLISAYREKLKATNTADQIAVNLAIQDLQAQIEAKKAAVSIAQTPVGAVVQAAFAFPVIVYMNKVIVWDKVLGWGNTDPITGDVGTWVSLIISFYFGGIIVSSILNTVASRFRK